MKTLGLLGGMSWESTIPYYRIINETVRERRGGQRSAQDPPPVGPNERRFRTRGSLVSRTHASINSTPT